MTNPEALARALVAEHGRRVDALREELDELRSLLSPDLIREAEELLAYVALPEVAIERLAAELAERLA